MLALVTEKARKSGERPLLIGGGAGVPPMYMLAIELLKKGVTPTVVLGFNKKSEVFYEEEFKALFEDVKRNLESFFGIKINYKFINI